MLADEAMDGHWDGPTVNVVADSVSPNGKRVTTIEITMRWSSLVDPPTGLAGQSSGQSAVSRSGQSAGDDSPPRTAVVTATSWESLDRGCPFLAQGGLGAMAEAVQAAVRASTPEAIGFGSWHLPYIRTEDWDWAYKLVTGCSYPRDPDDHFTDADDVLEVVKRISAARCAKAQFLPADEPGDQFGDIETFGRLAASRPALLSPMEHQCTPATDGEFQIGHLDGFHQFRHEVEAARC